MSLIISTKYITFKLDPLDKSHPLLRSELNINLSDSEPSKTEYGAVCYLTKILYTHELLKIVKPFSHYKASHRQFIHKIVAYNSVDECSITDTETSTTLPSSLLYTLLSSTDNNLPIENFKDNFPDISLIVYKDNILITAPKDKYSLDYTVHDQQIDEDKLCLKYFSTYNGMDGLYNSRSGTSTSVFNTYRGDKNYDVSFYLPRTCKLLNLEEFINNYNFTESVPKVGARVYKYIGDQSPLDFLQMAINTPNPTPDQVIGLSEFIRHTKNLKQSIVLSLSNCKIYLKLSNKQLEINLGVHTRTPL